MPRALIAWNVPSPGYSSMDRYASRLSASLRASVSDPDWSFHDLVPKEVRLLRRLVGENSRSVHADWLMSRFLTAPLEAFIASAGVYHIVDHAYGHLGYVLRRRPLVVTCHDLNTLRAAHGCIPGFPVSTFSAARFRWIVSGLRHADAVIAISESTRRDLREFVGIPDERIRVIHHGLDDQFRPMAGTDEMARLRHELGIPAAAKVMIHVSSDAAYKNLPALLRTLHILVHQLGVDVHLMRVGTPPHAARQASTRALWRLAQELGIEARVHEAGLLTDEQLVTAYNLADVMLFPSWWEGFGVPPLEAMACGTPVVLSNRASLPEVAGDAGVLVEPDDHAGMAQAVSQLLADTEWRRARIARGLAQAARFNWTQVAQDTFRVYQDVLRAGSASSCKTTADRPQWGRPAQCR